MSVCTCECHIEPDTMRAFVHAGVATSNVVEAAAACGSCRNKHVAALLRTELPNDRPPVVAIIPRGEMRVITPEGKSMTWTQYEREMEKRANVWKDRGEGAES